MTDFLLCANQLGWAARRSGKLGISPYRSLTTWPNGLCARPRSNKRFRAASVQSKVPTMSVSFAPALIRCASRGTECWERYSEHLQASLSSPLHRRCTVTLLVWSVGESGNESRGSAAHRLGRRAMYASSKEPISNTRARDADDNIMLANIHPVRASGDARGSRAGHIEVQGE